MKTDTFTLLVLVVARLNFFFFVYFILFLSSKRFFKIHTVWEIQNIFINVFLLIPFVMSSRKYLWTMMALSI